MPQATEHGDVKFIKSQLPLRTKSDVETMQAYLDEDLKRWDDFVCIARRYICH